MSAPFNERVNSTLFSKTKHTYKNLIPMVVTRAMANSSKNHALLMCGIWKMGWNLFSSLDIRENPLFVLFLHKSWIWQTLGHVTKKFSYCHFHNAPKECFWPKKNWISCTGSKVPFWQKWKIAKMALLNPCMIASILNASVLVLYE